MILMPELVIHDNLVKLFNFITVDFSARASEEDTILWQIFHEDVNKMDLSFNKTNYYANAKALFVLRNSDSPRLIEVCLGFNQIRASLPTIHIMMPSETPLSSPIGGNQGYLSPLSGESQNEEFNVFTYGFNTQYSLVLTSDNMLEVLLMYTILKTGFIGLKTQLELSGFQNVTFGGNDLSLAGDFVPPGVYARNFSLSFSYDFSGRDLFQVQLPNSFNTNSSIFP